jgi:hypothetical protein
VTTFVAVYRGESVHDARLLAVSSDPLLVARFANELLEEAEADDSEEQDDRGRLRVVQGGDED